MKDPEESLDWSDALATDPIYMEILRRPKTTGRIGAQQASNNMDPIHEDKQWAEHKAARSIRNSSAVEADNVALCRYNVEENMEKWLVFVIYIQQ